MVSAMSTAPLSDTAYAVLGLIDISEPTTPYRLKALARESVLNFWAIPHTQLYTECSRLAEAGLLDETREQRGRRRRVYRLTCAGRASLERWRADPQAGMYELRDPGLLKLFCGAGSPADLAADQLERHRERLAAFEAIVPPAEIAQGMRLALEAGIALEAEYIRFWERVAEPAENAGVARSSAGPASS